jgi:hypothetical protein
MDERDVVVVAEQRDDLFGLAQTHQAMVDEDAGELVADRLVDQHGGHGGVDATRKTQITRASPTWARISAILVLRNSAIVQSPVQPQT